ENIVRARGGRDRGCDGWRSPAASISPSGGGMDGEARFCRGGSSLSHHPAARREAMGTQVLERRFAAIGARVKVIRAARGDSPRIDVGSDRRGEFFELRLAGSRGVSLDVVEANRDDRSLLLLV